MAAEAARAADAERILKLLGREASHGERYGDPEDLGFMRTHSPVSELGAARPVLEGVELSPIFGDGLKAQAAAVWD